MRKARLFVTVLVLFSGLALLLPQDATAFFCGNKQCYDTPQGFECNFSLFFMQLCFGFGPDDCATYPCNPVTDPGDPAVAGNSCEPSLDLASEEPPLPTLALRVIEPRT